MIKVIPFKAKHLELMLNIRDGNFYESRLDALFKEHSGPAYSIIVDDLLIGSAGIIIPWIGFGIAWTAFTPAIARFPIFVTKTSRLLINGIQKSLKLRRLECTVLSDNVRDQLWAEALGFEYEGIARMYTVDGKDVIRYVRYG